MNEPELDLASLTQSEIQEEYKLLYTKYKQLLNSKESDLQRIHELKRNLEIATSAETFLSQELEQLSAALQCNADEKVENEELKRKHQKLQTQYVALQEKQEEEEKKNVELQSEVEELQSKLEAKSEGRATPQMGSQGSSEEILERLSILENENLELLKKLDEQRSDGVQQTMRLAERDKKIELMRDEVNCLVENMRYKRDELEEKSRMLESAQEQLSEANAKIGLLMGAPDNKDRKGNSLFAEVDDQRQAMKELLAAQKKSYQQMKKIYNESQYEIRRLKRENSAMHTELQACCSIFCNADRTYQDKLNGRIRYLMNQNEELERKLTWNQQQLKDLAHDKGQLWLDSMLNFCKQETDELKKQLHSVRIQNASLEEQLRNVQQEMARWRFESLKLRCIVLDRENLLVEHKISFRPNNAFEYRLTDEQIQNACPRIANSPIAMLKTKTAYVEDESEDTVSVGKPGITSSIEGSKNDTLIEMNASHNPFGGSTEYNNKENSPSTCGDTGSIHSKSPKRKILVELEEQCDNQGTEIEIPAHDSNVQSNATSTLSSILSKPRNAIDEQAMKSVKFSANEATVYNLSASPDSFTAHTNSTEKADKENNATPAPQTLRTKSNVIVRRFIVRPNPKQS